MKVNINALDHYGRGIAKTKDDIIFVKNALVGEEVKIKITKNKKIKEAEVLNYITKNEDRVVPKCPYYRECGGCNLMHLSYNKQLEFKRNKVEEVLKKFSNTDIKIKTIIPSEELNYRNKITLQVKDKIGLYKNSSNEIIPIDSCLICDKKINDIIEKLKIIDLKNIDKIVIKSTTLNETMIIFHLTKDVKNVIFKEFENIATTIVKNINNKYQVIFGKDFITEKIDNFKFKISADSFFQINTLQAEKLFEVVKNYAGKGDNLLDLYCGTGTIGLYLSYNFNKVIGIESNKYAVENAKENALINDIKNTNFLCDKVENLIDKINNIEVIVVDPPRSGLDINTINNILRINPKKLVYASCDSVTLARDLKSLKERYALKDITLVDMFPNTYHIESIVLLESRHI